LKAALAGNVGLPAARPTDNPTLLVMNITAASGSAWWLGRDVWEATRTVRVAEIGSGIDCRHAVGRYMYVIGAEHLLCDVVL